MYTYVYTHVRESVAARRRGAWGGRRRGPGSPAKGPKKEGGAGGWGRIYVPGAYHLVYTLCILRHRHMEYIYIYICILTFLCAVDAGIYLWWLFGQRDAGVYLW